MKLTNLHSSNCQLSIIESLFHFRVIIHFYRVQTFYQQIFLFLNKWLSEPSSDTSWLDQIQPATVGSSRMCILFVVNSTSEKFENPWWPIMRNRVYVFMNEMCRTREKEERRPRWSESTSLKLHKFDTSCSRCCCWCIMSRIITTIWINFAEKFQALTAPLPRWRD